MYVRCHGCSRLFMPAWANQLACKRACRQRAWLRRHFGPPQQAPDCCVECGERLIDTEHPTRRYCDCQWLVGISASSVQRVVEDTSSVGDRLSRATVSLD